jgi:imidazole glycerol-phosphate synthase subunit HisH
MSKIAVIDYGSGNLHSVANALNAVIAADETIMVTDKAADILAADRIVLPGVGAFADCYRGLCGLPDMIAALRQRVLHDAVPFLGICVGMQLLSDAGYEHETSAGLGWISGAVQPLTAMPPLKIPHMGWNTLTIKQPLHPLFKAIANDSHMYFVHSYHFVPQNATAVLATTTYGYPIIAAIGRDNMLGTQFHPEKSQQTGLQLLRNFLDWRV